MAGGVIRLGVIAVSQEPVTRWGVRGFVPSAVMAELPQLAPITRLGPPGDRETWYLGAADLVLYRGDTGHYRDNLGSGRPSVWVAVKSGRAPDVVGITADPYEGEGWAGDPGLVVEAVAMPAPVAARLAAFFAAHHVEETFVKRKRQRSDPEALGRAGPRVLDLRDDKE